MSTNQQSKTNSKIASARSIALGIINKILIDGAYPDLAVQDEISKHKITDANIISFINEVVYGVIRWKLTIDYKIEDNTSKKIKKPNIHNLLRMGVYQLKFMGGVKDYASINETVKIGKQFFGNRIGNFINAVLRNIQRKDYSDIKFIDKADEISVKRSFPKWIIHYWLKNFDLKKVDNICSSLNHIPTLSLRVNKLKIERDLLLEKFKKAGIESKKSKYSNVGINLIKRINPVSSEFYKDGLYSVQDEAAQLISFILDPKPGEKILDACSAPGGKSTHLAEIMKNEGEIISCDMNDNRLRLVNNQIKRLGTSIVKTENIDLENIEGLKKYKSYFDKILLDAPCSGLGTIRRNPDIKWKRNMVDIEELSTLQYKILTNVSSCLKTGGILVYSVCTLSEDENEKVINKFLENNTDFELEEIENSVNIEKQFIENNYFLSYTDLFEMDCFFGAKLRKIK